MMVRGGNYEGSETNLGVWCLFWFLLFLPKLRCRSGTEVLRSGFIKVVLGLLLY